VFQGEALVTLPERLFRVCGAETVKLWLLMVESQTGGTTKYLIQIEGPVG